MAGGRGEWARFKEEVGYKALVTALVASAATGALIGMVKEASHSYRRAYASPGQPPVPPRMSPAKG